LKGQIAVEGQAMRSELFLASVFVSNSLTNDVSGACGQDALCSAACGALQSIVAPTDFGTPSTGYFGTGFPKKPLTAPAVPMYLAYEAAFLACADKVAVSSSPPGLSVFSLDNAFSQTIPTGVLFNDLPQATTVGAAFRARSDKLAAYATTIAQTYERAKSLRFGYYTREQEADEMAVAHLAAIGIDPRNAVEMVLTDGKALEERLGEPALPLISARACEPLYRHQWRDSTGAEVYVHVGDLADTHHSMCYRARHLDVEIDRRELRGSSWNSPVEAPASPTWDELRASTRW
jgi:hypothetical protein